MSLFNIKEKLFLSFDVETDGPTPIVNNLLSIGIVGITMNGEIIFEYEANIEPLETHIQDIKCMETFWLKPEQKNSWDYLKINRRNYIDVFEELGLKLKELDSMYELKFVAHPACFDWMFLKCYYELAKTNSHNEKSFFEIGYKCECSSTLWNYYKHTNKLNSNQANELFKVLGVFDENSNHMALSDAKVQGRFYVGLLKKLTIDS